MESRACSFSDNSAVSFDITMGVEGEETAKPSRGNYLQTSTPFVRSKLHASSKGGHTSLGACEELDEQSCCVPQDMSLEASAINASSTTATGIALLSKSDESNSLVADDGEHLVSVTTSASEMNVAFWDSSLKGLTDSSSRLPESSVVSGASSELASCPGNEASGECSIAEDNLADDLTEQGMLNTSETEPSDDVRGRADEAAVDRRETENAELSQVSSETAADNPGEQSSTSAAATEAAQVEDSASGSLMAKSSSSASIYLDDGTAERRQPSKKANPPKRLTIAQRATLEAMAAFGGSNLSSVQVRRVDLHAQLKEEARKRKQEEEGEEEEGQPLAKRTRLQTAKLEAEETFQHAPLGGGVRHQQRGRNGIGKKEGTQKPYPRRLTRVEQARLEALQSFNGSSLTDTLGSSKRRVARTLEAKAKDDEDTDDRGSSEEQVGCEDKENSMLQA